LKESSLIIDGEALSFGIVLWEASSLAGDEAFLLRKFKKSFTKQIYYAFKKNNVKKKILENIIFFYYFSIKFKINNTLMVLL
jgi:hypothetical protein